MEMFEITILYQSTYTLLDEYEDLDEDSVVKIRMRNDEGGEFKTDTGYFDLATDPIMHLYPKHLFSKDGNTKKYYTEIIFESGNHAYALGKPETVYKKLKEYLEKAQNEKD